MALPSSIDNNLGGNIMVKIKDAILTVKEHWVKTYGDEGFYNDDVYSAILLTYKKDPTTTTYAILEQHLTPTGYKGALMLIEIYCNKRVGISGRFKGVSVCGRSR